METVGSSIRTKVKVMPTLEIERAMKKHQYWFDRYLDAVTARNRNSRKYAKMMSQSAAERLDDLVKKLMTTDGI